MIKISVVFFAVTGPIHSFPKKYLPAKLGVVAHICHSSYSGGWQFEASPGNKFVKHHLKIITIIVK
jgi:hypothetical protein